MLPRSLVQARPAFGIVAGAVGIALLARVEIPFFPVPMTLLTLGAMLSGVALGARGGASAVGAYLLAGAVGMPVFAGGKAGFLQMFGPTAGYLWALPLLGWAYGVAALQSQGGRWGRRVTIAAGASLGHLLLGGLWLSQFTGIASALAVGVLPFVLAETAKGAFSLVASRLSPRRFL